MRDGKLKAQWSQTSTLCWLLAEPHRNRRKRPRPFEPKDFDPYRRQTRRQVDVVMPITVLQMFLPGQSGASG